MTANERKETKMTTTTSKRIQKHLIDRDDTLYYDTGFERAYVSAHDGFDDVNFSTTIWSEDESGNPDSVTFYFDSLLAIELSMRLIQSDLRKWRVLKNGG